MLHLSRWPGRLIALAVTLTAAHAAADSNAEPNNPYRYNLRTAVFPLAFRAGISQSSFGSGVRAEYDVVRHFGLNLSGQLPWWNVAGETDPQTWSLRAGVLIHFVDDREMSPLAGTVHPEDTPVVGGPGPGTDTQLAVPVHQRLGGPRMGGPEPDPGAQAKMRQLQTIRLGYDFVRAVQRGRPYDADGTYHYFLNTFHGLYVGYGWGSQWNLSPGAGGGERRVGWRRFYVDGVLTLGPLDKAKPVTPLPMMDMQPTFLPVGVRAGMEGAIDALLFNAPGVGFAYNVELGALPGKSGLEGYLLITLGLELDFAAR